MAELLDPRTVRRIADRIGLRPTKQRGQNFVVDANTVRRIVAKSGVGADDVVLEVGPGLGSLTLGLLEAGAKSPDRAGRFPLHLPTLPEAETPPHRALCPPPASLLAARRAVLSREPLEPQAGLAH